ncbi:MAG: hypothetical protein AAFX04_13185 [Pseudomonadota bacterium]
MSFTTTPKGFAENAPKAGKAFDRANDPARKAFIAKRQAEKAQAQERTQSQQHAAVPTKAELDHLTAQRATPKPTLALTPDGSVRRSVDQAAITRIEDRIRFIEHRLDAVRNAPKRSFSHSR